MCTNWKDSFVRLFSKLEIRLLTSVPSFASLVIPSMNYERKMRVNVKARPNAKNSDRRCVDLFRNELRQLSVQILQRVHRESGNKMKEISRGVDSAFHIWGSLRPVLLFCLVSPAANVHFAALSTVIYDSSHPPFSLSSGGDIVIANTTLHYAH